MKTGFVAAEPLPLVEHLSSKAVATSDKASAIYQIGIIAAAVLLVASAAFL